MTRTAEQLVHGGLLGAVAGCLAGGAEYVALREAFSGGTRGWWDILVPYVVAGAGGGLLIALLLWPVTRRVASVSQSAGRQIAWITAAVVGAYVVVWSTYALGRPVLKVSNLVAYALTVVLMAGIAWLLQRVAPRLLGRVDGAAAWHSPLRALVPLGSLVVGSIFLLVPPVLLARDAGTATAAVRPASAGPGERPNLIVIVIDTLRADHLPFYGYSRQTAPNLSALARQGMLFTQMYAQAASTRPSVATMFSSLYPAVHKTNENRDYFSNAIPRLPEFLQKAGYRTFAISANANVSPTFGYAKGFDDFVVWKQESAFRITMMGRLAEDTLTPGVLSRLLGERAEIVPTADAITDGTLRWVDQNPAQPFFLYLQYIDPHDPYRPPAPYDRSFDRRTDPPRRAGGVDPLQLLGPAADREKVGRWIDLYDGEILYADHHVGRLLQGLETRGLLRNSLVLVTSDHGEEFFEHGGERHGTSTYEELIRVPLIAWWPGRTPPGTTVSAPVTHLDLLPTLLEVAGVPVPPDSQGRSIAGVLRDPAAPLPSRLLFAQIVQDGFELEMIRDGRYKLVRHNHGPRAGQLELYDLESDPLERENRASKLAATTAGLLKALNAFNVVVSQKASEIKPEQVQKLDRDTERALRSLGYIK